MLTGYVDEKRTRGVEERRDGRGKVEKGGKEGGEKERGRGTMGTPKLKSTNGAVVRPPAVYGVHRRMWSPLIKASTQEMTIRGRSFYG